MVTDTAPGGQSHADGQAVQSTISRFACRIICQRDPPYAARIYAAGFDSSKNIFLGVSAVFLLAARSSVVQREGDSSLGRRRRPSGGRRTVRWMG